MKIHKYAFKKVVYKMCIQLEGNNKHNAVRVAILNLVENVQIVNPSVTMMPIGKNGNDG